MGHTLEHKIKILFEYRKLPTLPSLSSLMVAEYNRDLLFNKLEYLQKTIYHLDHALETMFDINQDLLNENWQAIYKALDSLGITEYKEYCKEIYSYQKHELSIREGDSILDLPMEHFYYFKSCDVKLIRRIIYDAYPDLHDKIPLEEWKTFDLITEINDDVEDVFEDLGTINGNRYLLEIQKIGINKTTHNFKSFIIKTFNNFNSEINHTLNPLVRETTENAYLDTLLMLDNRHRILEEQKY